MELYAYLIFGIVGFACFVVWLRTRLRYRLDGPVVRISLFGIPLRSIHVSSIARIGKRPTIWTENWGNVWNPGHRQLVLHRKGRFRRPILLTPLNRYVLMASIDKAMKSLNGTAGVPEPEGQVLASDSDDE